jgi:hypothetical protein
MALEINEHGIELESQPAIEPTFVVLLEDRRALTRNIGAGGLSEDST